MCRGVLTLLPSGLSGQGISSFNQWGTSSQALVYGQLNVTMNMHIPDGIGVISV